MYLANESKTIGLHEERQQMMIDFFFFFNDHVLLWEGLLQKLVL